MMLMDMKKKEIEHPIPEEDLDPEVIWLNTVYQGDHTPQLTLRALVMGSALGSVMSLSNLYVGLKTGWGLGVAITSCILSFAIYQSLMSLFPKLFPTPMTLLENNCMQSTASSAGYSTGGTLSSAIAAYLIMTGHSIAWPILGCWTFFLASLGVFMAIPMKRQMINIERLRFPSGIAAAETLKSLHARGSEATSKARSLGFSGFAGALIAWLRDARRPFAIPSLIEIPGSLDGIALVKWTISFDISAIMIAAGAIMGWKLAWSMLLGGVVNYSILAPWVARQGGIPLADMGYRAIVSWSTWIGASMMVTSGLLNFAFQWKTMGRAFAEIGRILQPTSKARRQSINQDRLTAVEVPSSWFLLGTFFSGMGCIAVMKLAFGTSVWMGILSVFMTFFLSLVACRATGESDITPIGAMGKITQLIFGALAPMQPITNLMTAGMTAGAAGASADLLTDLKSGYLLSANPRKQFMAQFVGIFTGVLVVVPAFYLIIPDDCWGVADGDVHRSLDGFGVALMRLNSTHRDSVGGDTPLTTWVKTEDFSSFLNQMI
jgi:OPT family oligopeptide transporter